MGGPIGSGSDCYVGHADLRLFEKKVPLWCNICSWLFEYEHNSIGTLAQGPRRHFEFGRAEKISGAAT